MERLIRFSIPLASAPGVIERPELNDHGPDTRGGWIVTVYDNDINTVDEVIVILIRATGCSLDEAQLETWEIHNLGRSVVHHGAEEECRTAAKIIARIGIQVEVSEE